MIGILQLESLTSEVTQYFQKLPEANRASRIIGVVFCLPNAMLTSRENSKVIEYFNYRSGQHVNFYFAGYAERGWPGKPKIWDFCPYEFDKFRQALEAICSWRFSGGIDLILFNARYKKQAKSAIIDFTNREQFQLKNSEGTDVGGLFESIFRYCDERFNFKQAQAPDAGVEQLRKNIIEPAARVTREDVERLEKCLTKFEKVNHLWTTEMGYSRIFVANSDGKREAFEWETWLECLFASRRQ